MSIKQIKIRWAFRAAYRLAETRSRFTSLNLALKVHRADLIFNLPLTGTVINFL